MSWMRRLGKELPGVRILRFCRSIYGRCKPDMADIKDAAAVAMKLRKILSFVRSADKDFKENVLQEHA